MTEIVRLADPASGVEVTVVPAVGNMAIEMKVRGRNVLWFPYESVEEFAAAPALCGIPFLGPWANRIDGDTYWVNGRQHLLNPALGNLRRDSNGLAIHGLLNYSPLWTVVDQGPTHVTSRIEFWRHPLLMAQFPFAHNLTMTYRLMNGELEVATRIENLSVDPMPVAVGYHPYFQVHDAPRDDWRAHIAARDRLILNGRLTPTGEISPIGFAGPHPLRSSQLDDVFAALVPDPDGRARFWVEGLRERVTVTYGPRYTVAVVYAPAGKDFICFEPMAAVTNAFNLAHEGVYDGLQSIAPGESWEESFWIAAGL